MYTLEILSLVTGGRTCIKNIYNNFQKGEKLVYSYQGTWKESLNPDNRHIRLIVPDYWCCCYLQKPTILLHRRPKRSETVKSFLAYCAAELVVLCMWIQSRPGYGSGCMWPLEWLWLCPSNYGNKYTVRELQKQSPQRMNTNFNSYLPLRNRNVITSAWGALILAPYLKE